MNNKAFPFSFQFFHCWTTREFCRLIYSCFCLHHPNIIMQLWLTNLQKHVSKWSWNHYNNETYLKQTKPLCFKKRTTRCIKLLSIWNLRKELDHIGSIVRSFILHCKRLFLQFESVSHDNNFIIAPKLPFKPLRLILIKFFKVSYYLSNRHSQLSQLLPLRFTLYINSNLLKRKQESYNRKY